MHAQYLKSIYSVTGSMDSSLVEFGKDLIFLIKKEYDLSDGTILEK